MTKARDLANAADALDDVSATELGYVNGVTSAIQTQLNNKQAVVSGVDDTEIGYLNGVTSSIQTQLDGKIAKSLVDAAGDLIYGSANDTVTRLGIGTAGQYLSVNSGATAPEWTTLSAGGMTSLASGSIAASATGVDLSSISNAYKNLMLVCRGISANTDAIDFYIRLNNDSGANYYGRYINGSTISAFSGGTSAAVIADSTGSYTSGYLIFNLYDYANTSSAKAFSSLGLAKLTTHTSTWGFWNSTSAVDRITFFNNGSFDAGTYILYGVK